MNKPHILLLKKQIKKLDAADFDLEAWKVSTQLLLTHVFGKYDEKTITIRDLKIDYSSSMLRDSDSNYRPMETCMRKGKEILALAVDQLEIEDPKIDDPELIKILSENDEAALNNYLKKMKKEELLELLKIALNPK